MPTEFFRSGSADDEEDEAPPPPAVSVLSLRFGSLAGPSVGVAMPEFVGLCEGCLKEVMSTVGEGRLGMGVSMVDGREMEDGFTGSSFFPAGRGSVAKQQHTHMYTQLALSRRACDNVTAYNMCLHSCTVWWEHKYKMYSCHGDV